MRAPLGFLQVTRARALFLRSTYKISMTEWDWPVGMHWVYVLGIPRVALAPRGVTASGFDENRMALTKIVRTGKCC